MNCLIKYTILIFAITLLVGCTKTKDITYCEEGNCTVCYFPKNPYDPGTGHYAGFEWAEKNQVTSCDGSSQSFNEGCEEFVKQSIEYYTCP